MSETASKVEVVQASCLLVFLLSKEGKLSCMGGCPAIPPRIRFSIMSSKEQEIICILHSNLVVQLPKAGETSSRSSRFR